MDDEDELLLTFQKVLLIKSVSEARVRVSAMY